MAIIDIKHPHAKRVIVIDEKGDPIPAVIKIDTSLGYIERFDAEQKKHEDLKDENGKVTFPGKPYFMLKKDDKGNKVIIKETRKFTLKWRGDDGEIVDVPNGIVF